MIHLLSSAMMPQAGHYDLRQVTPEEFSTLLRAETFISYIGYDETAHLIESLAGVPVAVSREQTRLEDGDTLLIARLRYRVQDPATKRQPRAVTINDFEFFEGDYER